MAIEPLPDRYESPKPLRLGLERVMRSLGLPSTDAFDQLFNQWPAVVGEELAGCCQPVSLDRGSLVIKAADQAWATQLRWLEQQLVDRCAASLGSDVVRRVVIRL